MKHECSLLKLAVLIGFFFLSGCEGGNSKTTSCPDGQVRGTKGNCTAPTSQCPQGETLTNGSCKPIKLDCPEGQHLENNQCLIDTTNCPNGQIEQNGQCVPKPLDCEPGFHQENDICVRDPLDCEIDEIEVDGECVLNILSIDRDEPEICSNPDGSTSIKVKFVVRDASGKTIAPVFNGLNQPTVIDTQLYENGGPLDVEAKVNLYSDLLESDLAMSLVLDSTSSMLQHNPPAFLPMKTAARTILKQTKDKWEANGSSFHWELTWFNNLNYRPIVNNAGETWTIDDVINIPEPEPQSYTGLYKAIAFMTDVHRELYLDGVAAGPRDQHVMVIFTDGEDNYSFVDNSDPANTVTGSFDDTLFWQGTGYKATTRAELAAKFALAPNLKVFVIGFGDRIVSDNLKEIARNGSGSYFFGDDSNGLVRLFETVGREFITEQTLAVTLPLQPKIDPYTFTIESEYVATGIKGQSHFQVYVSPGTSPFSPCEP